MIVTMNVTMNPFFLKVVLIFANGFFPHIKHTKNKIRRKIVDEHLENTLRIRY